MDANTFWNLKASDLVLLIGNAVMIWAVIQAPKWAVKAQWELQLKKEERERRLWVFKTLMKTRATPIAPEHVQALNMIDVVFCSKSESDITIREAWKSLLSNLNTAAPTEEPQIKAWVEKNRDLLVELLSKMGAALDYDFGFTYLKNHGYFPKGQDDLDQSVIAVQKGWAEILNGEKTIENGDYKLALSSRAPSWYCQKAVREQKSAYL